MNRVKPINVGVSLAGTVVVLYLACALFVWLVPHGVESVVKLVAHSMNLDPVFDQPATVTVPGVLGGTFAVAVYFFVTGWVFAMIYNRFAQRP